MNSEKQISIHDLQIQEAQALLNNLALTPQERLLNHQKALNLLTALQDARKDLDEKRS